VLRVRPEPSLQRESTVPRDDTLPAPAAAKIDARADARVDERVDEYAITAVRSAAPKSGVTRPGGGEAVAAGLARPGPEEARRGRVEPTFDDGPGEPRHERDHATDVMQTAELPDRPDPAPTLSSSESPPVRRIERRKILSLRLSAAPNRFDGAKLQESLQAEALEHGKYSVFHRMHPDGVSVFSIASMVEPGTFDPEKMAETQYPGITLFAQLPGPVPGMHALNELVACARRLQQSLGGTLQDDRGVPLTVHRIERLRQEVREFERPAAGAGGGRGSPAAPTMGS
jgi:cell division protein ZipA